MCCRLTRKSEGLGGPTVTYRFTKMQGCGNDYLYFDCFAQPVTDPAGLARRFSDRHFGVGSDGVILILPSEVADARMRIFNADGSEGKMCGNGVRCVGKYLYDSGRCKKTALRVETGSGIKTLQLEVAGGVARRATVGMGPPDLRPAAVPALLQGERVVNAPVKIGGQRWQITCVSMGNPHCVVFVDCVDELDLTVLGPLFAGSGLFPEGINAEFVQPLGERAIKMRVYERGSGETLACGTGACAAAVAAIAAGRCRREEEIAVSLPGGQLQVRWGERECYLSGPAETVFCGQLEW